LSCIVPSRPFGVVVAPGFVSARLAPRFLGSRPIEAQHDVVSAGGLRRRREGAADRRGRARRRRRGRAVGRFPAPVRRASRQRISRSGGQPPRLRPRRSSGRARTTWRRSSRRWTGALAEAAHVHSA